MVPRWAVFALVLVLCGLVSSSSVAAQSNDQRQGAGRKHGTLGPNQPNPFPSETTIPFSVGDSACQTGAERHVVSLRIYNILSQVVAIPVLVDSTEAQDSTMKVPARPVTNLPLPCGSYSARWNGTYMRSGRRAAPGVYMYQLIVDGRPSGMRKMLVARP